MPVRFCLAVLLLLAALTRPAAAQTVVRTVPVEGARDLVAVGDRLVVGVGGTYTAADGLAVIDPATGTVTDRVAVDGGVARLAASADGATLYAGLALVPGVARFAAGPWREVSRFSLGIDDVLGSRYANDLVVDPADSDVVVVTRRSRNARPSSLGVAVFEDGMERDAIDPLGALLAVDADGRFYAYDGDPIPSSTPPEDPESILSRLTVSTDGVTGAPLEVSFLGGATDAPFFGSDGDFVIVGSYAVGSNGIVIDLATDVFVGRAPRRLWAAEARGVDYEAVVGLPALGRVAFLARSATSSYLVVADVATTEVVGFTVLGTGRLIRDSDQTPRRLVRWGDHGLAYVADGAVVLIESALLTSRPAVLRVDPQVLHFGTIAGAAEASVVVRNPGTEPLRVEAVVGSVPELSFVPSAFELAPGAELEGTVRVVPSGAGAIAGTLAFENDGGAAPVLAVSATARFPRLSYLRDTLDFEEVAIGGAVTIENVVFNNDVRPVRVASARTTDPRFEVVFRAPSAPPPFTMDPRNNRVFDVTFRPDAEGAVEAELILESDAYVPSDTLRLDGVGAPPTSGEGAADLATGLGVPFPNPARAGARVPVTVATGGPVRVALYDALAREVAVVFDAPLAAGSQAVPLPLVGLPPGAYLVRMEVDGEAYIQRVIVSR